MLLWDQNILLISGGLFLRWLSFATAQLSGFSFLIKTLYLVQLGAENLPSEGLFHTLILPGKVG